MRRLGNVLLVVVSLVLALAAAEIGLRLYYLDRVLLPDPGPSMFVPHPTRSFAYRPGNSGFIRQFDAISPYRINKAGYRGPELDDPKRRFRILVVGDSAVGGSGVGNDRLFTAGLEQKLGADRVEVVNSGTPAYNAVQILLALRDDLAAVKPDLVIFGFAPVNDIQGGTRALRELFKTNFKRAVGYLDADGELRIDDSAAREYYQENKAGADDTSAREPYIKRLVLYQIIKPVVKNLTKPELYDPNILLGWPFLAKFSPEYSTRGLSAADYERLWDDGWAVMRKIILEARRESEAAGARFAVTAMPGKVQVSGQLQQSYLAEYPNLEFDVTRVNRALAAFAEQAGIASIDLIGPVLEARDSGVNGLFLKIDHHLAAAGHEVLAQALARQLKQKRLVPFD